MQVSLYSSCFLNLVAGEPKVVFGHFYPADPDAGEESVVVAVMMSLSKASLPEYVFIVVELRESMLMQ